MNRITYTAILTAILAVANGCSQAAHEPEPAETSKSRPQPTDVAAGEVESQLAQPQTNEVAALVSGFFNAIEARDYERVLNLEATGAAIAPAIRSDSGRWALFKEGVDLLGERLGAMGRLQKVEILNVKDGRDRLTSLNGLLVECVLHFSSGRKLYFVGDKQRLGIVDVLDYRALSHFWLSGMLNLPRYATKDAKGAAEQRQKLDAFFEMLATAPEKRER